MKSKEMKLMHVFMDVEQELLRAQGKFPPMRSLHEGFAILQEEVDELWEAVKDNRSYYADVRREAVQVAAMACRLIFDVLDKEESDE